MRRRAAVACCVGVLTATAITVVTARPATQTAAPRRPSGQLPQKPIASLAAAGASFRALLDQYCVTCHNARTKAGGLDLSAVDDVRVEAHVEVWEKVVRKVRAGMMPPPGMPRPEGAALEQFAWALEQRLDAAAAQNPNPGRVGVHRLNRFEYVNAVEELLSVRVDPALLPKDEEADGFDNIAAALRITPSALDQYVNAARTVSVLATGDAASKLASVVLRPARGADQSRRIEGMPPGTRGGLLAEHVFPADGEYKFTISGLAGAFYVRGMEYAHKVVITVDGVAIFEGSIGGEEDMRAIDQQQAPAVAAINARFQNVTARVAAGPHLVGATFVARSLVESDEVLYAFRPGAGEDRIPRIAGIEIVGPVVASGVSDSPSRRRLFTCRPSPTATASEELGCARRILTDLSRRAYRRLVTAEDLKVPLALYNEGRAGADFDAGIRNALVGILANPRFLFRAHAAPQRGAASGLYRLSDLELASRLSFFLLGRQPDQALIEAAAAGKLQSAEVLQQQVRRLLGSAAALRSINHFASQWLKLRALDDIDPDGLQFPNFDASLREAFKREVELFVSSIVRENRSVLDLLTANYTFINERLALHYGVPHVRGDTFQRVTLEDPNRRGLLGKGAVLMATSYGNRTAPVVRGAWILENLLGTPPASPPPDVEGFPENRPGEKSRTVREILEEHRRNPTCASCHRVMDPLGFALENFDAIGAWRDIDRWAGTQIDATGQLIDGTKMASARDLTTALTRRPEQFVQTLTEKLMTYAIGRTVEAHDMPAVRRIVRDAAKQQFRFESIVLGIVQSAPFQMRRVETPGEPWRTVARSEGR